MSFFDYPYNKNKLASYLIYNGFRWNYGNAPIEYRYFTGMDRQTCDEYNFKFQQGDKSKGCPVHLDFEIVENWYPKKFSERVDYILLYINKYTEHMGQSLHWNLHRASSVLFIDKYDYYAEPSYPGIYKEERRGSSDCLNEIRYMLDYLVEKSYIKYEERDQSIVLSLTPEGYSRVDELQKNSSYGRNVFVAMRFGAETKLLREAIRKGIKKAGYNDVYIDEKQYNGFIAPEILKEINNCNFLVVDLTHENNGAYFEAGYAMGKGKQVIQLCKEGVKLHFDIAQKNTIMWKTEEDIPESLCNRIKATID